MKSPRLKYRFQFNAWESVTKSTDLWLCGAFVHKYFPRISLEDEVILEVSKESRPGALAVRLGTVDVTEKGSEDITFEVDWNDGTMEEDGGTYTALNDRLLNAFDGEFPLTVWVTVEKVE